jgi:hypothetical protein
MMNVFRSRHRLIVAVIILLAGGVVFAEWHRAVAIAAHHFPSTELTNPAVDVSTEFVMTNKNYEATVDLWLNPGVPVYDTDISYANYMFESALHPVDYTQLPAPVTEFNNPASFVNVVHKDITYSLFTIGSFKATFNMTPTKAKPDDLFPTQLKPGLGGSFDF